MPRALITGAGGQLGWELQRSAPAQWTVRACSRAELDITDADAIARAFEAWRPELLINAAAYTAVDRAEDEPEAAQRINAEGPAQLARACAAAGVHLLHVSTDFVFDGKASRPYRPEDATAPLGVYGRSKCEGERAVCECLPGALLLRTGWVYSAHGSNFVRTMLRLMAERDTLRVVSDQVGTPTWAHGLADVLWAFAARPQLGGIHHWSDAGVCSWYDFAQAIAEEALTMGLLSRPVRVVPIAASEYPTPAARPAFSVLDKRSTLEALGMDARHWRVQLRAMLAELHAGQSH
jgi:dTDP-4-dehydrorhamnose reductase